MKTRKQTIGKQFGPEAHQYDPFDGMTDSEFEAEVLTSIVAAKQRQKAISIKLPEALLEKTRAEARRRGIPYQTLIKIVLEKSLDRLGAEWLRHSSGLTPRLVARVERDFGNSAPNVLDLLRGSVTGNQSRERVLAAIVLAARGDLTRLKRRVDESKVDWRDVLVAGGLADEDWRDVLDRELGPRR